MYIKSIAANLWDIFWGTGWNNHARIAYENGQLKQVLGIEIPPNLEKVLVKKLTPRIRVLAA